MSAILRSTATWKWALLVLMLVAAVFAARMFPLLEWVKSFAQWAEQLGTVGALLYGVVFGIVSMLMLPSIPFTIIAGFAFGMLKGVISIMFGIAVGASLGFQFARYAARGAIAQKIAAIPRFNTIDRAIARDGWKIVGLLRMCPVPFGITNISTVSRRLNSGATWVRRLLECCLVASHSFTSALLGKTRSMVRVSRSSMSSADSLSWR